MFVVGLARSAFQKNDRAVRADYERLRSLTIT